MAANFCSKGWHESFGIMVSVVVGFLNISKVSSLAPCVIVRSRKFSLPSHSRSNVNIRPGVTLLNKLRISSMFVRLSLQSKSTSSTYPKYPSIFEYRRISEIFVFSMNYK